MTHEPTVLSHSTRIEAPVDSVWRVLADLEAVRRYNPTVAQTKIVSPSADGIGATRSCELKPRGRVVERVTHWEPMRALGIEVVDSTWPIAAMRWRTNIRADRDGTLLEQSLSYRPKFGVLGALMNRLVMRRAIDKAVAASLHGLKTHVEATRR